MLPNEMIRVLDRAEREIPGLLDDPDGWNTLFIDYEPPIVERLWREFETDYRVYLHRIYPCETALYHPHPWPSAVKIMTGPYEMGIGYEYLTRRDPSDYEPPITATVILTKGSSYEMTDKNAWHYVKPLGGTSYSIMVTGPKWDRWAPKVTHKLGPLKPETKEEIIRSFRHFYGK